SGHAPRDEPPGSGSRPASRQSKRTPTRGMDVLAVIKRCLVIASVLVVTFAAEARTTVGGPTVCDVLGWDPAARRVYVHEITRDAGGGFGKVISFELTGSH